MQLSSADLKKPLEKETVKLAELQQKAATKVPGKWPPAPLQNHYSFVGTKVNANFLPWSLMSLPPYWHIILAGHWRCVAML